jgi:hypothetical protein
MDHATWKNQKRSAVAKKIKSKTRDSKKSKTKLVLILSYLSRISSTTGITPLSLSRMCCAGGRRSSLSYLLCRRPAVLPISYLLHQRSAERTRAGGRRVGLAEVSAVQEAWWRGHAQEASRLGLSNCCEHVQEVGGGCSWWATGTGSFKAVVALPQPDGMTSSKAREQRWRQLQRAAQPWQRSGGAAWRAQIEPNQFFMLIYDSWYQSCFIFLISQIIFLVWSTLKIGYQVVLNFF